MSLPQQGTTYTFVITANNNLYYGVPSSPITATTNFQSPHNLIGSNSGINNIALSWNAPFVIYDDISGYMVTATYGNQYGQFVAILTTLPITSTSVSYSSALPGTTYTIIVKAIFVSGSTYDSAPYTITTLSAGVPTEPSNISASIIDISSVQVTWAPPILVSFSAINGYTVTCSGDIASQSVSPNTNSVIFTGLTRGTNYSFSVTASNSYGAGASSYVSITTPTFPDAPVASAQTVGTSSITVSWAAPANNGGSAITGYTVSSTNGLAPKAVANDITSATFIGLSAGASYSFTVVATNAVGNSVASNTVSATTINIPSAPVASIQSVNASSITVSWTAPTNNGGSAITEYTVSSNNGLASKTVANNITSAIFTGLSAGTSYSFTVVATNAVGNSVASNTVSATTYNIPDAPIVSAQLGHNLSIRVSWAAPNSYGRAITNYLVTCSDGTFINTLNLTAIFTNLALGTTYSFTVVATNAIGDSLTSSVVFVKSPSPPDKPSSFIGVRNGSSVLVSWSAPLENGSPITKYTVTCSTRVPIITVDSNATFVGLNAGTSYDFTVVATNYFGDSSIAGPISVTITSPPGAPTGLTGSYNGSTVALSWNAPANIGGSPITGYRAMASAPGVSKSVDCSSTNVSISGITSLLDYSFRVWAINGAGISPPSSSIAVPGEPPIVIKAIEFGSSGAAATKLRVKYDPAASNGLAIQYYGLRDTSTSIESTLTVNEILLPVNRLVGTYLLWANNGLGDGRKATITYKLNGYTTDSTTPSAVTPSAVNNFTLTPLSNSSVQLSWSPPSNTGGAAITSYSLYQNNNSYPITGLTATLTGISTDTFYTYSVAALNSAGTGPYSTISVPNAPTTLVANIGASSIALTWAAPVLDGGSPITNYYITYKATSDTLYSIQVATTNMTSLIGLTPGTSYTFMVAAINAVGIGPSTSLVISTTT